MAQWTPRAFWNALYAGDVDAITELLESEEMTLDEGDSECGMETPLMRLCHTEIGQDDTAAILELMLMKSPHVNVQDCEGRSVLCHACMSGQTYVIQRLSRIPECDPNLPDCYGNSALMFAVYYGDVHVLETLLTSFSGNGPGVDISAQNNEGISASMIAEQNQYHDIAEYLVQFHSWALANAVTSQEPSDPREETAPTQDSPQHVGSRVRNFRRQKLRHALGPLVVQNKLQTSKSADYSKYYHGHGSNDSGESPRQVSYSAGAQTSSTGRITDKLYRQTAALGQPDHSDIADDFEASSGDESDDGANSDVYDENEDPHVVHTQRPRRGSNSLPDLRNGSKKGALVAIQRYPEKNSIGNGGHSDSGYDTRSSQCTVSREELLLPNLPEGGFMTDDEDDYTPRTRRGSFSLPDLRGLNHGLVAGNNSGSTPRLRDISSNSSTPRRPGLVSNASTPELRRNDSNNSLTRRENQHRTVPKIQHDDLRYIQDFIKADFDVSDDSSDDADEALDCEETLKFSDVCTPRDIGLKLPMLGEVNSVANTPRVVNLPGIGFTPNQTPRGNNLLDINKKLTKLTPRDHRNPPDIRKTRAKTRADTLQTPRANNHSLSPQAQRTRRPDQGNTIPSPQSTRAVTKQRQKVILDRT